MAFAVKARLRDEISLYEQVASWIRYGEEEREEEKRV
jgi:hypothetical protein